MLHFAVLNILTLGCVQGGKDSHSRAQASPTHKSECDRLNRVVKVL